MRANKLIHIYENEIGITCFDRYFDYLNSIRKEMPDSLANFACDVQRYQLNGEYTLHDAWLESLNVVKTYSSGAVSFSSVQTRLLLAHHRSKVNLIYEGVVDLRCSLGPDQWPSRAVDLLVHEFSKLDNGLYRHLMQFDREVWIEVTFSSFDIDESKVQSG